MKNLCTLLLFITFYSSLNAQSLQEARFLFDNFEYELAANAYEKNNFIDKLETNDIEKLTYCYLYLYNSEKGLPLVNSLLSKNDNDLTYWLWKLNFEKYGHKYDAAISSAEKYLALGGTELPINFIESCRLWKTNGTVTDGELINSAKNDVRANFEINNVNQRIYLKEIELDSVNQRISEPSPYSGILLMRPFIENNGKMEEWYIMVEDFPLLSINSIQVDSKRNKVYFSASKPLSVHTQENRPIIYSGEFEGFDHPIQNIQPWSFSGIEDSSSCAHVALSNNGTILVYSKVGKNTSGSDLYISHLNGEEWSTPKPISFLNTIGNEMFPVFSGDSVFYYSSDGEIGYGNLDIFKCKIENNLDNKSEIQHLSLPINSEADDFLYSPIDELLVSFISNRKNGKGDDDIWYFRHKVKEEIIDSIIETSFDINAFLANINQEKLYYEFDKSNTKDSFSFLSKLHDLIDQGFDLKIEVLGFADSRGSNNYNQKLGLKRAQFILNQLVNDGFDKSRLSAKSFGEENPENICGKQPCSETEHAKNRFVRLNVTVNE